MLRLLVHVGRVCTVIAGALTILVGAFLGYAYGISQYYGVPGASLSDVSARDVMQLGSIPFVPQALGWTVAGATAGLISAGVAFGALAALFDVQRSLRELVQLQARLGVLAQPAASSPARPRVELGVRGA